MAGLDIVRGALSSRVVRQAIGQRIIRPIQTREGDSGNSIVNWLWNGAKRLGNFLLASVGKAFSVSWTTLWSLFTSAAVFLFNFNWNATDEELNAGIQAQWTAIAGQFGGVVGNALGYVGCGFIPAATVMAFNEPLGRYLFSKVSEEFLDEFVGNLAALSKTVFTVGMQTLLTWSYQNVRKWIKSNSEWFGKIFGNNAKKAIDAWGAKGSKPWSFALKLEELVEKIPNEALRNFVEEALEEAWEGCVEAGYVLANAADTYQPQRMLEDETNPPWGNNLTVEIIPNRSVSDEKINLQAPEPVLRGQIVDYLSNYAMMRNKDIGIVYGTPPQPVYDRKFKPHVYFYFKQPKSEKLPGQKSLLTMEVSLRLIDKDESDFQADTYLKELANKIKNKFAKPPYRIKKGNKPYIYDDDKWLKTQIWAESETQARAVVETMLDIVGQSPDWKFLKPMFSVEGSVSQIPEKVNYLGQVKELPVKGKSGTVQFEESWLLLYGNDAPITLVDLTGKRANAVVDANLD